MAATFSSTPIVIDGKGHLLGRLASIISKQVLNGQKIVVVRCEEVNISGSFFRNKVRIPMSMPYPRSRNAILARCVAPLPQLPPQATHCQPEKVWTIPSPRAVEDPLPRDPRHGPAQDSARRGCS
jgi:hypothetical protein